MKCLFNDGLLLILVLLMKFFGIFSFSEFLIGGEDVIGIFVINDLLIFCCIILLISVNVGYVLCLICFNYLFI